VVARAITCALVMSTLGACGARPVFLCHAGSDGAEAKYVVDHIALPFERTMFAVDLNGDKRPDNEFGFIFGAIAAQNIDVQLGTDQTVERGALLLLLDEHAASLQNGPCGHVVTGVAQMPAAPLKFDGTDVLTVDSRVFVGDVLGALTDGEFNSSAPTVEIINDARSTIMIVGAPNQPPVALALHAARLRLSPNGETRASGQLNGAVREDDMQNVFIPYMAGVFTRLPGNSLLLDVFDTGGTAQPGDNCMNSDGTPSCRNHGAAGADFDLCAQKGDRVISTCELATSQAARNETEPDIQLFDSTVTQDALGRPVLNIGHTYQPSAANLAKDSVSIGFDFTAVKAVY
jgi:hypothetical protein